MKYDVKVNLSLFRNWEYCEDNINSIKQGISLLKNSVQNEIELDEESVKELRNKAFICYQELDRLKEQLKRLTKFTLDYLRSNPK